MGASRNLLRGSPLPRPTQDLQSYGPLDILTSQPDCTAAFRYWADAMISCSKPRTYGWVIEGKGLAFSNYTHGAPGTITTEVMLGADQEFKIGVVKIVQPDATQGDRGKLTVAARDKHGRLFLLREGRLQPNRLSRGIIADFTALSGLKPVQLLVSGSASQREWFVVADLSASLEQIVAQTAAFTLACAQARARAGGGDTLVDEQEASYTLGWDEKGHSFTVVRQGGEKEVTALHGYVWRALAAALGKNVDKPRGNGFSADAITTLTKLLIEIKTGTSPRDVYEAVGQLTLYPSLIGLGTDYTPVILVPDTPPLKPLLASALHGAHVEVFSYAVSDGGDEPSITFSDEFLSRCGA